MISLPPFRGFVRIFVLLCIGFYVLQVVSLRSQAEPRGYLDLLSTWAGLEPGKVFGGEVWRLVTWVFLHSPTMMMHLFFNMLSFYFFGSLVEQVWGTRRFWKFCLWAALFSAGAICLGSLVGLTSMNIPTIGASGIVYAMIVAVARMFPNQMGIFLFVPMKMKYLALLIVGIDLLSVVQASDRGISYLAHLSGALFGFLYVGWTRGKSTRGSSTRDWMESIKEQVRQRKRKRHLRIVYPEDQPDRKTFH